MLSLWHGSLESYHINHFISGKTIEHIGTKINPGFSLKGLINILGFKLRCTISINFRKEILLEVSFSPIKIASGLIALQRTKKDEENGPKLHAKISADKVEVNLQAYASLLGISAYVNIEITDDYMRFHTYGNLFNVIAANLTVQSGYQKLEEADFLVSISFSLYSFSFHSSIQQIYKIEDFLNDTHTSWRKVTKHYTEY